MFSQRIRNKCAIHEVLVGYSILTGCLGLEVLLSARTSLVLCEEGV